jgi:hypothetical protein
VTGSLGGAAFMAGRSMLEKLEGKNWFVWRQKITPSFKLIDYLLS